VGTSAFSGFTITSCGGSFASPALPASSASVVALKFTPSISGDYRILLHNCGSATNTDTFLMKVVQGTCRSTVQTGCAVDFFSFTLGEDDACAGFKVVSLLPAEYTILITTDGRTSSDGPMSLPVGSFVTTERVANFQSSPTRAPTTGVDANAAVGFFLIAMIPTFAVTGVLFLVALFTVSLCCCLTNRQNEKVPDKHSTQGCCYNCGCFGSPQIKARKLALAAWFFYAVIAVSSWAVIWSIASYFLGLGVAIIALIVFLHVMNPRPEGSAVTNEGAIRTFLIILGVLLILDSCVAAAQSALAIVGFCTGFAPGSSAAISGIGAILCAAGGTTAGYGFLSMIAEITLAAIAFDLGNTLRKVNAQILDQSKNGQVVAVGSYSSNNQYATGGPLLSNNNYV
jgi:hypothetical protein